jgi:Domain of unknown function (DUF4160)
MAPTVAKYGAFRFFFFSREESRAHVHVEHPDGEAKYWLQPEIELATSTKLNAQQLKEAKEYVVLHSQEMLNAWQSHFGS